MAQRTVPVSSHWNIQVSSKRQCLETAHEKFQVRISGRIPKVFGDFLQFLPVHTDTVSIIRPHDGFLPQPFRFVIHLSTLYSMRYSLSQSASLTPQSTTITLRITRFNIQILLQSAHTVYKCVLYGPRNKLRLFPYTTLLTFWRRIFFFQILAHPVFKMCVIQKPNKVALWNKRHFEEKKWRLYSMFKILSTDICWINI